METLILLLIVLAGIGIMLFGFRRIMGILKLGFFIFIVILVISMSGITFSDIANAIKDSF